MESRLALRIKHLYEDRGATRAYRINFEIKMSYGILLLGNGKFVMWKLQSSRMS